MILTKAQAEAVYTAMCALNNVGAACMVDIPSGSRAQQDISVNAVDGDVVVRVGLCGEVERYRDQAAFATAYGLS